MWIFRNDAFLSIVEPATGGKDQLVVRARFAGDIERVFPGAEVQTTPQRDYLYRALIPRREVAMAMAQTVEALDYGNFKASVDDPARHDAYLDVWTQMVRAQRNQRRGKQQ